jgi:hypothetical protein
MLDEYPVDLIADPPNGFKVMNFGSYLINNPGYKLGVILPFILALLLNYFLPLTELIPIALLLYKVKLF